MTSTSNDTEKSTEVVAAPAELVLPPDALFTAGADRLVE